MSQLDRHLGILTILLRQRRTTSRYLAERFEVSTRTIHRDIDSICRSGIPLVAHQGAGGGIEIMDGYSIDRSVFTLDEIETLICALRGADSVLTESYTDRFLEKLSGKEFAPLIEAPLEIDLADYHAPSLSGKIRMIRKGICEHKMLRFSYFAESGDSVRSVEPYRLLFRWGKWYLYAYCQLRNNFRLFKLQRLWDLEILEEAFIPRPEASVDRDWDDSFTGDIHLRAVFDACVRYRILEEYDPALLNPTDDGRYLFSFSFAFTERLVSWLLSFGSHVEILDPPFVRERVIEEAKSLIERNNHDRQMSCLEEHTEEKGGKDYD